MAENLMEKLQSCGNGLMRWAEREFGSVRKKKKKLYQNMSELQNSPQSEHNLQLMKYVEGELEEVLKHEETMWSQRSRALWLEDGDKNTKFFHQ